MAELIAAPAQQDSPSPTTQDLCLLVSTYLGTIDNIGRAAAIHIPLAVRLFKRESAKVDARLARIDRHLEAQDPEALADPNTASQIAEIARFYSAPTWLILAQSLFVALFSSFDAFIGDLLTLLYRLRPDLIGSIDRAITIKDIIAAGSLEALQRAVVAKEVDQLRRESYAEQFKALENRFGLRTLRAFPSWGQFVETAQRRNLIVHCGGRVTEQYLSACRDAGYTFKDEPKVGAQLHISAAYLQQSAELLCEVGFKLSQTLWRKLLPAYIDEADGYAIDTIYSTLVRGHWKRAEILAEFALSVPEHSSDERRRTIAVNHAQALKWSGNGADAIKLIERFDWSCSDERFLLAVAVLRDDFATASELMRQIGANRSSPSRVDYHGWPLFREFRKTPEFASAYLSVFGEEFAVTCERWAQKEAQELAAEQNRLRGRNGKTDPSGRMDEAALPSPSVPEHVVPNEAQQEIEKT